MHNIDFITVNTDKTIGETSLLAFTIWPEHYEAIIGAAQVKYMLRHFQTPKAIHKQIQAGYEYFLIALAEEKIGYFALLHDKATQHTKLSKLYVLSRVRKQGIARKSLAYIIDHCHTLNSKLLWLTVNKYNTIAINAYTKLGFKNAGSIVQDIGNSFIMDDYKMYLPLE